MCLYVCRIDYYYYYFPTWVKSQNNESLQNRLCFLLFTCSLEPLNLSKEMSSGYSTSRRVVRSALGRGACSEELYATCTYGDSQVTQSEPYSISWLCIMNESVSRAQ